MKLKFLAKIESNIKIKTNLKMQNYNNPDKRISLEEEGQGIFWQTVCQLRLAIGKANCGTPHLPTRDG